MTTRSTMMLPATQSTERTVPRRQPAAWWRRSTSLSLVALVLVISGRGWAEDVSPPAILQWFEASYKTMKHRTPDVFLAGYGAIWIPPPGRAGGEGDGTFSVGYDVYDRFDLGTLGHPTHYGTEEALKEVAAGLHRADVDLHIDFVINHNGFRYSNSKDRDGNAFVEAGDYPGFVVTLPNDVDGDFHSAFASGDLEGRLDGLIDIAHGKNHRFIRNPVTGFVNNIPAGKKKAFGRLADQPDNNNRRFYPDRGLPPILLFDPRTGEPDIKVFPFNLKNPLGGTPIEENAMGYLMRNAQWLVQVVGADGFRIDAAKHVDGFVLDFFDRAVYRSSPRRFLDGSQKHVFSYGEANFSNRDVLQTYVKKTIRPDDPGRIGANRDTLDFALFFKLRDNLTSNGLANNWLEVKEANLDHKDDGLHNGSSGVKFISSHDDFGPHLSNVAHAYVLLMPGPAVVYHHAKEFGDTGNFPKPGRGDALGGLYGKRITRLLQIRNSHGRGNYRELLAEKELFAFERQGSAVVLLSNRLDGGFDSRTLKVSFPPGTPLVELTGNASDPAIDPNDDIPELVIVNPDQTLNVRFPRNAAPQDKFHGSGYLIYGLATPQSVQGIELTNVAQVLAGEPASAETNGTARLAGVEVIKADSFQVKLKTNEVKLLGITRDPSADGDNALLRIDGGLDLNGNGKVDFTDPRGVSYGFEQFQDKHSPLIGARGIEGPHGDGEFVQTVDATKLEKGLHFLEVRAFRHRPEKGPAVYSSFKKTILIDRP